MVIVKVKFYMVMVRLGQKCWYEIWQLLYLGIGFVGVGYQEIVFFEFSKEGFMFVCKLYLFDGIII